MITGMRAMLSLAMAASAIGVDEVQDVCDCRLSPPWSTRSTSSENMEDKCRLTIGVFVGVNEHPREQASDPNRRKRRNLSEMQR
jgi:hypothetical protein